MILLGGAGHLVLPAQRQDLHEADIEEQAFHDAGEGDQALQESLVSLVRAGLERWVGQHVDVRQQEFVLRLDAADLVIGVEDFALVEAQAFHDVLVGVSVDGLLERLAQQILAAFRRGDLAIGAEHDVVGGQTIGGDEETQVALDDVALVLGQPVGVFPCRDVAVHVHFLRHPVVRAGGDVLFPGPLVLEWHQLIHVGLGVDDQLVFDAHAAVGDVVCGSGLGSGGR